MSRPLQDDRRRERGFTLVELIIVLFVMGLLATLVVVNLPGDDSAVTQDAERFAARVAAARDEAVIGGRPVSVWISPSGYGFEQRRDGLWVPLGDKRLDNADWRDGVLARAEGEGAPPPPEPGEEPEEPDRELARARFYFDATGLPNRPLTVTLSQGQAARSVAISATGEVSAR